jgi:hypothetical protein
MHELLIFVECVCVCTGVEKLLLGTFTHTHTILNLKNIIFFLTHPRFSNLSTFDFECLPMKLAKCDLFPSASWAIVEFERRTSFEASRRG